MATLVLSNHTTVIEDRLQADGKEVIVCLTKPVAAVRMADPPGYEMVTVSHWHAFGELADLARDLRGRVDRIATLWEGALVAAGFLRDLLDLPGQRMSEALGFTDKAVMKTRLARAGVPVARHRIVRSVDDVHGAAGELGGYPVVVKPLSGFASTNTYVVRSFAHLQTMRENVFSRRLDAGAMFSAETAFHSLAEQGQFLVEEYIDIDTEYHCDGFWRGGQPVYHVPGRYNVPPLRGMGATLGSVLLDPGSRDGSTVAAIADRAARTLGLHDGFSHAEVYRSTDGRWLLGEIAARPGGGGIQPTLGHAYGLDVPAMLAQHAVGDLVTANPRPAAGVFGWAGTAVPPGRITQVVQREALLRHRGVIDATVVAAVGGTGGPTGTGLWGGLAGYVFLHADATGDVLALMDDVADWYAIRVEEPLAVGA
ncbi:ATP-grasp domain-containing protein [Catellatospora sp. NPDC049133]|uniref:ATP-grasp domain-containing protein n=1 Tax=Catellatospora sp. NPDC049133 TaxID=3155499 RepID=UPI0033DC5FD5